MVLLYPAIEIFALADANWFRGKSRPVTEAICKIAGNNCLVICLAAVNVAAIRAAMARKRLSKEALPSRPVTVLAEEALHRVA